MFRDLRRLVSFKNMKKHLQRSAILLKLQVLRNTPPEVFLTLLNEANCPKPQAKTTFVKRKLHAVCISSVAIPERKIHGVKYARIRVFSNPYFPVYGKIQVRENPYSRIFYTVVSILIRPFVKRQQ